MNAFNEQYTVGKLTVAERVNHRRAIPCSFFLQCHHSHSVKTNIPTCAQGATGTAEMRYLPLLLEHVSLHRLEQIGKSIKYQVSETMNTCKLLQDSRVVRGSTSCCE